MIGRVLVVGSLNMDLVVNAPRLPQAGETILGGNFSTFPGGKGANQAVAAARIGAAVTMVGSVGRDAFGTQLLQTLARDGIDTSSISALEGQPTGIALITVDALGRNTIVVASGANACLTPQHLQQAQSAFAAADVLILQLETPLPTVRAALEAAHRHGCLVVLNPAPACTLDPELLRGVDYLIPNEGEALQVAGSSSLEDAIQKLSFLGVKNLIITLGAQGALLVTPGGRATFPAFPVNAVDTVAAGDAFVGTFSASLAAGISPQDAIRWANAAAAISVTRHGAQPSLPTRDEVRQFLQGMDTAA